MAEKFEKRCRYNERTHRVEYCPDLKDCFEDDHHRKGLVLLPIGSMRYDSIWYVPTLKSGTHAKNGIIIEFCPFCGAQLTAFINREASYARGLTETKS